MEEMVRVLKLDLEARLGAAIEVNTNGSEWLVEHATDLIIKLQVGRGGKTAYERCKGKLYKCEMYAFASPLMLRVCVWKSQRRGDGSQVVPKCLPGPKVPLNEYFVARLSDGVVVRSRSIKGMDIKVPEERLKSIEGSPWMPAGVFQGEAEVLRPALPTGAGTKGVTRLHPKNMRIKIC